jgi:hypothetical protein
MIGRSPNQGHSPILFAERSGGAEPRLTSGGKADADGQCVSNRASEVALSLRRECRVTGGIKVRDRVPEQVTLNLGTECRITGGTALTERMPDRKRYLATDVVRNLDARYVGRQSPGGGPVW